VVNTQTLAGHISTGAKMVSRLSSAGSRAYIRKDKLVALEIDASVRPEQDSVILIHGFSGGKGELIPTQQFLESLGFAVHRVTWSPVGLGFLGDVAYYADQLCTEISNLSSGNIHVVSHSMGGLVAAELELYEDLNISSFTAIASPWVAPNLVRLPWRPDIVKNTWAAGNKVTLPQNIKKWLCIGASEDTTVTHGFALLPGAKNIVLAGDHSTILDNRDMHASLEEHISWLNAKS
jgi:pimeloyl-ACP methyl ester carboxylesterase